MVDAVAPQAAINTDHSILPQSCNLISLHLFNKMLFSSTFANDSKNSHVFLVVGGLSKVKTITNTHHGGCHQTAVIC